MTQLLTECKLSLDRRPVEDPSLMIITHPNRVRRLPRGNEMPVSGDNESINTVAPDGKKTLLQASSTQSVSEDTRHLIKFSAACVPYTYNMLGYMVLAVVVAGAVAAPSRLDLDNEWQLFKQTHSKQYAQNDEAYRRAIWESNLNLIIHHNLEADRGLHSYRLGMNPMGDMTREEFVKTMNGYKMSAKRTEGATYLAPNHLGALPDQVDWRKKGYVTPVKNQKHCGSCWAFSSTGSLEGQHFKKTGKLVSLSEQNLVDCSKPQGNHGCEGGLMDQAFTYIKVNNGIDTEESYSYTAKDGKCHFKASDVGATDVGFTDVTPHGDEKALQSASATVGPISVAIDASHSSFHLYQSGVYYEPQCDPMGLDHGVLVVGYGSEDDKDYWLVKNSWDTTWGEDGYIKMSRNRDNNCGVSTMASYPNV